MSEATRVSLSDWLAFQARIRGSKDPRLLRDRPSDGAASVRENLCGFYGRICAGSCGCRKGMECRLWRRAARVSQIERPSYGRGCTAARIYACGACKLLRELG